MVRRLLCTMGLAFIVSGCPKSEAPGNSAPAAPLPEVLPMMSGIWSGTTRMSPRGTQVYGLVFRQEGAALIAETPVLLSDEKLAPGAAQRFVFPEGPESRRMEFKTALGDSGSADGLLELVAEESTRSRRVYAEAGTRARKLSLKFESQADGALRFQTFLGGVLHMDVILRRTAEEEVVMESDAPGAR